jgi:hypothetical protein
MVKKSGALRDPDGANLDRVQVIKGWLDKNGKTRERIYDVAVSDGREIGADGRCRTGPIPRQSGTRPEAVAVAPGRKTDILDRPFHPMGGRCFHPRILRGFCVGKRTNQASLASPVRTTGVF